MQFKAGDCVVHPAHGVGHVRRLEERRLAEDEPRLYYVIVADKATLWVPVDPQQATQLRELTPRRDLEHYRDLLKSSPVSLQKDHYKRRLEIAERLKQGSFEALCAVVRDLTARGRKKLLNEADASLLQKIRLDLCREWAASAGVSLAEAIHEVDSLLQEGREASVA
ncbi:MAG TPA: CarD family transcriptional regulator [Anaerolineae bacterium]|nr:CarD family transcriptional regulator [Anaerolineae bacterium]